VAEPTGVRMKAPRMKAKLDDDDRRLRPLHMFGDVGPAIAEADYQPRVYGIPEQTLAAAFNEMKQDYDGPLPADFVLQFGRLYLGKCNA